jgi:hypothetical protein
MNGLLMALAVDGSLAGKRTGMGKNSEIIN